MNIYNIEEVDYDQIHDLEFYIYDDYIQFSNESTLHVLNYKETHKNLRNSNYTTTWAES